MTLYFLSVSIFPFWMNSNPSTIWGESVAIAPVSYIMSITWEDLFTHTILVH